MGTRSGHSHGRWGPNRWSRLPWPSRRGQECQGRQPRRTGRRPFGGFAAALVVLGLCTAAVSAQAPVPINVQLALPKDLLPDFKITYISTLSSALEVVNAWPCQFGDHCPRFSLASNTPVTEAHVTVRMCNSAYTACEDLPTTPAQLLIGMAEADPVPGTQHVALAPTLQRMLNTSMQLLYKLGYSEFGLITATACAPQATPMFSDIHRAAQLHQLKVATNPGFSCAAFADAHMHVFLFAPHSLEDAATVLRDLHSAGLLTPGHMYLTSPYFNDFDLTELAYYMHSEAAIMDAFERVAVSLTLTEGDKTTSERVAFIRAQAVRLPRIVPRFLTPEHTSRTAALWDAAVFLVRALRAPNANGSLPCAFACGQPPCISECFAGLSGFSVGGAASQDFVLSPQGSTAYTELRARRVPLPPFQQVVATATVVPPTSSETSQEAQSHGLIRRTDAIDNGNGNGDDNDNSDGPSYDLVVFRNPATSAPVSAPLFYFFSEDPTLLPPDAGPTRITVGVVYGRSIRPTASLAAAFDAVVAGAREFYAAQYPEVRLVILTRAAADKDCADVASALIDEGVHALIGGITSQCTVGLADVAASRNVLHFSVTSSMILEHSPQFVNTFQLGAAASGYVNAMTRVLQMANVSCVSVVFDSSSDTNRDQADQFVSDVQTLGIDVRTTTDIGQIPDRNATFWEEMLSMLRSEGASTVALFLFPVDASMLLFEGSKHASVDQDKLWLANHIATATDVFPVEVKTAFDGHFVGVHTGLREDFEQHPFFSFASTAGHQSFMSTLLSRRSVILAVDAVHILFWAADRARFVHNFARSGRNQREALVQQMPRLSEPNALEGFSVQRLWFHNSTQMAVLVDVVAMVHEELDVVTHFCSCDLRDPAGDQTATTLPDYFPRPPCRASLATTATPTSSGSGSSNTPAIGAAIALSVVVLVLLVTFRVYLRRYLAKRGLKPFDFTTLMQKQAFQTTKPLELPRHIVVSEERLNEGAFGMVYRGYLKDFPSSLLHNLPLVYVTPGSRAPDSRRAGSTSPAFARTTSPTAESPLPDDVDADSVHGDARLRGGGDDDDDGYGDGRDDGVAAVGGAAASVGRPQKHSTSAEGMNEEESVGSGRQRPKKGSRGSSRRARKPSAGSTTGPIARSGKRRRGKPRQYPCVAIKQCKYIHNNADTMQLMQEALYLQALKDCRNVVRLLGVLTADERPSMVLEYCKHGSLDNFLRQKCLLGAAVSWRVKARMLTHVALGLLAIHERNIVHCDIACRNILVGRNLVCKICDFGAARAGPVNRSMEGLLPNVPLRWTAPEVLRHATYSFFSDVWSFGTLAWEVASNAMVTPYHELTTQADVVQAIYQEQHLHVQPQWPEQLQDLLALCWKPILQRPTMTAVVQKAYNFRSWTRTSEFEIRGLAADVSASLRDSGELLSATAKTSAAGAGAGAVGMRLSGSGGAGAGTGRGGSLLSQSLSSSALVRSHGPPHSRANLRGDCMYASSNDEDEAEVLQAVRREPIELDAAVVVAAPSNLNQLVSPKDPGARDAAEEGATRKHTPSPRGEYTRLDVSQAQQVQNLVRRFGTRESGALHPEYCSLRTSLRKQHNQQELPRGVTRAARSLPFFDESASATSKDTDSQGGVGPVGAAGASEAHQDEALVATPSDHEDAERLVQSALAAFPLAGPDGDATGSQGTRDFSHYSSAQTSDDPSPVFDLQPSRYGPMYYGPFMRNDSTATVELAHVQRAGAAPRDSPARSHTATAPIAQHERRVSAPTPLSVGQAPFRGGTLGSRRVTVLYGNEEMDDQEPMRPTAAAPPLERRDGTGSTASDMSAADAAAMRQLQADSLIVRLSDRNSAHSSARSSRTSSVV